MTLARARASASSSRPIWWVNAPQHCSSLTSTTSMPWRVSTLMAAWLIRGASTCCAQPCSSATRPRRGPSAAKTLPAAGPGAGKPPGASASIALMRRNSDGVAEGVVGAGSSAAKGRASRASHMLMRNSFGSGSTQREHPAQQPLGQRPAVIPLDPDPRLIDQMHVVHAGRTGRHAGQTRQAAVDVLDHGLASAAGPSPASP